MSLKTKYDNLPKPIQYIAIGGTAFILYMLYKKLFGTSTDIEEAYKKAQEKLKAEELANKQKPSYPLSNYILFSNALDESMKYGIGDNYSSVVDICKKMNNDKDVQLFCMVVTLPFFKNTIFVPVFACKSIPRCTPLGLKY